MFRKSMCAQVTPANIAGLERPWRCSSLLCLMFRQGFHISFWSNPMNIWNFNNVKSSLPGHLPSHDIPTPKALLFSPWVNEKEARGRAEGAEEREEGEAGELTHPCVGVLVAQRGTESSGALLNISSIWCRYHPSDHHDPILCCSRDSRSQAGGVREGDSGGCEEEMDGGL